MSENIEFNVGGDALEVVKQLQAQLGSLNKKVDSIEKNTKDSFASIAKSISQVKLESITNSIGNFKQTLEEVNAPGMALESSMADLSAITGITGEKLDEIEGKARKNAKAFGGDAAGSVEVYKLLLSQLSPVLGKFPTVLDGMGNSVSVLSKTMKGDTTAAVEVLTTALNQYRVSMDDPIAAQKEMIRFMNAMAAGAKEGSAELPQLKAAIQNVGGDAKSAKLSFEEMVSSIEFLDKAGKKGAEGGVALRNVIASLEQGRFLPKEVQTELAKAGVDINKLSDKTLKFTDRMRALRPIQNDAALLSKLFGKENKLAAEALLQSVDAQDKMTAAITGTNTAQEQADVIMKTRSEQMKRIKAHIDDFKIALFEATGAFGPLMTVSFSALQAMSTVVPAIKGVVDMVNFLRIAENRMIAVQKLKAFWTGVVTGVQWAWNAALNANPIGLVVAAIVALVAIVTVIIKKYDDWGAALTFVLGPLGFIINLVQSFRRHWDSIVESFKTGGIVAGLKRIGLVFLDAILMPFQQLLELAAKLTGSDMLAAGAESVKKLRKEWELAPEQTKIEVKKEVEKEVEKAPGAMPFSPPKPIDKSTAKTTNSKKGVGFSNASKKEIKVSIENLVGSMTIHVAQGNMSTTKIRSMIEEALVGGVRDFETAIGK